MFWLGQIICMQRLANTFGHGPKIKRYTMLDFYTYIYILIFYFVLKYECKHDYYSLGMFALG